MPVRFNSPLAKPEDVFRLPRTTNTSDIMALPFHARKRWIPRTVITPDYTNQLDLFSEADVDIPASVASAPELPPGEYHARPPQLLDSVPLAALPPENAASAGAGEPAGADARSSGGAVQRHPVQSGVGPEN